MINKLDIAKEVVQDNFNYAKYGIFDCRNMAGDSMKTIYCKNGLVIDICYEYGYFEVFGLTRLEFHVLEIFYHQLVDEYFSKIGHKVNKLKEV